MTADPARPLPRPTEISQPFWDACRDRRLLIQRCESCARYVFIPQAFCPQCLGRSLGWVEAAGTGSIVSYTVVWRAQTPAFETPYVIAVVLLDEGVDMLTNLIDVEPSELSIGARVSVTFVDVQDYNTPPLQGLDGEIYQPGSVDYHAAMTELLLHGFNVGGDPTQFFEPVPADKVAVGFLTGDTTPAIVSQAMEYIITGKAPAGTTYKLRNPAGYPAMIGAMFWTIDADQRSGHKFSNVVGPQLHSYPAAK